jgi:hypothetical protein
MPFMADHIYRGLMPGRDPVTPSSVHLTPFPEPDAGLVDPDRRKGLRARRAEAEAPEDDQGDAGGTARHPEALPVEGSVSSAAGPGLTRASGPSYTI